jgi:hypothetical protein
MNADAVDEESRVAVRAGERDERNDAVAIAVALSVNADAVVVAVADDDAVADSDALVIVDEADAVAVDEVVAVAVDDAPVGTYTLLSEHEMVTDPSWPAVCAAPPSAPVSYVASTTSARANELPPPPGVL